MQVITMVVVARLARKWKCSVANEWQNIGRKTVVKMSGVDVE